MGTDLTKGTDLTEASPLLQETKGVQTLEEFAKETANEASDMPLDDFSDISEIDTKSYFQEITSEQLSEEMPKKEPEVDAPAQDYAKHGILLGEAAFEFLANATKEIAWRRTRVPETKYFELETSSKYPAEMREVFRKAGFYKIVKNHNLANKELIGLTPEEVKEGKILANILFEKYAFNPNLGPEGKMALLLGNAAYRNYQAITDDIERNNLIIRRDVDAAVESVKQMFENQKKAMQQDATKEAEPKTEPNNEG